MPQLLQRTPQYQLPALAEHLRYGTTQARSSGAFTPCAGRRHAALSTVLGLLFAACCMAASAQIAFQAQPVLVTGPSPFSLATGDFDGDGKLDLAVAASGNGDVYVYTGSGDGVFHYSSYRATGPAPVSIVAAHLRHVPQFDLIAGLDSPANPPTSTYGLVGTLLGNANGTFQSESTHAIGSVDYVSHSVYSVAVDDFDQDGYADIVATNAQDNTVSVLFGHGDGTFEIAANYQTGISPRAVVIGDFAGLGNADIAVADFADNTVSILLNNGNGSFGSRVSYAAGTGPNSIAVGDFNGDGIADLAVTNFGSDSTRVLIGDGHGHFAWNGIVIFSPTPTYVATGDFDGDGILDLAIADYSGGYVYVERGVGDGTFQFIQAFSAGAGPNSIVIGNFNEDGKFDLAVADRATNTVTVLLNVSIPTDRVFSSGFEP
ncbi:MAG TPA: VCBS repeat-containing protein [Rudaea sp.]|jgi:hypothetical protein|nr:VCBS repeat-containing protein [Rudaea sp.]